MWLDEVKKLAAGIAIVQEHVSDDVAKTRYEICLQCPKRGEENNTCAACGCYLDLKTKAYSNRTFERPFGEITHCPLGKWGDLEIANYYRLADGKPLIDNQ